MFRPRVVVVLLLSGNGLVKSTKFKKHRYIGDPINAVRIFNDKKADELIFLDIRASKEKRCISLDFVKKVAAEANMPFGVGGGIRTLEDIRDVLKNGAEKVILNSITVTNPGFVRKAVERFGSSTIAACIDIKTNLFGKMKVAYLNGSKMSDEAPQEFAKKMESCGAGELIIQYIDKDGTYQGYDLAIIKKISETVTIPVVALGGAGNYQHLSDAIKKGGASAAAAGSIFVYHGPLKAVLISYPTRNELMELLS